MAHNTEIISLPQVYAQQTVSYGDLPHEAGFTCVAELHEIAILCNRQFKIQPLDICQYRIGLCVGMSKSANDNIAVFYVADGMYVWVRKSQIHPFVPSARCWTEIPLETGMHYLFGPSKIGPEHIRAELWGKSGRLKDLYFQQHCLPPKTKASGSKKNSGSDESDGAPPVLHPDSSEFQPIKSLDELGLCTPQTEQVNICLCGKSDRLYQISANTFRKRQNKTT